MPELQSLVISDLFAGPGGWSVALRNLLKRHPELGEVHELGLEWAHDACATRLAAGFHADCVDITSINDPKGYVSRHGSRRFGLIASPPCQSYSMAGKQTGRDDPRGELVNEVLRWTEALEPEWVACEQVPAVAPIWAEFAEIMQDKWGYETWTGVVNAADYGVPQFRERALLLARRTGPVDAPTKTHGPRATARAEGLKPYVTLAQALKVDPTATVRTNNGAVKRPRGADGKTKVYTTDGTGEYYMRYDTDRPAPAVTRNANRWYIQPRRIVAGGAEWTLHQDGIEWHWECDGVRVPIADAPAGAPLTIQQMGILQSFPARHPWQGRISEQSLQAGNAIPPQLAEAALKVVLGL